MQKYSTASGQGLSEYGLTGVLIAVVSIGALSLLGENFTHLLQNWAARQTPKANTTISITAQITPSVTQAANAIESNIPKELSSDNQTSFRLSDGTIVNIAMPQNLSQSVQTAGANGTTTLLANSLQDVTKQLLEAGKINQNQANALYNLANQAHYMAEIAKTVETAAAQAGTNTDAFMKNPITFEGKTYANAYELAQTIGEVQTNQHGPQAQKFWEHYQQAYSQLQKNNDPSLIKLLNLYADQLYSLSNSTVTASTDIIRYRAGNPSTLVAKEASNLMHSQSSNLCGLDKRNSDTGLQCMTAQ